MVQWFVHHVNYFLSTDVKCTFVPVENQGKRDGSSCRVFQFLCFSSLLSGFLLFSSHNCKNERQRIKSSSLSRSFPFLFNLPFRSPPTRVFNFPQTFFFNVHFLSAKVLPENNFSFYYFLPLSQKGEKPENIFTAIDFGKYTRIFFFFQFNVLLLGTSIWIRNWFKHHLSSLLTLRLGNSSF